MTTTYANDAGIQAIFGVTNANTWADLDNDANAGNMTARYDAARVVGYTEINDRLRPTHYVIPFSTAPQIIKTLEAWIAGLWMANARGEEDSGPEMKEYREKIEKTFGEIIAGKIRLDAP
jgi:hypothetical protein